MATYISKREINTPGVSLQINYDTAQWDNRLRNNIIRQIKRGVYSKSVLGDIARNLVKVHHGVDIEQPCWRWYGPVLVRKEYLEEQVVKDMMEAVLVTAELRAGEERWRGPVTVEDAGVKYGKPSTNDYYNNFMYYSGEIKPYVGMITFEDSSKWKAIATPVIERILAKDTFVLQLTEEK